MTADPIASAALGYAGPRRDRREVTGPMTRFGREATAAADAERAPLTPDRP